MFSKNFATGLIESKSKCLLFIELFMFASISKTGAENVLFDEISSLTSPLKVPRCVADMS